MKNTTGHYFQFSRKEKNGIIIILAFTLLISIIPYIYAWLMTEEKRPAIAYSKEIALLKELKEDNHQNYVQRDENLNRPAYYNPAKTFEKEDLSRKPFSFNPNTLDIPGWQRLGVKEKTATGIRHYIEKGGRFRQAQDINKIWGLGDEMKKKLLPYISIPAEEKENGFEKKRYPVYNTNNFQKKTPRNLDINNADTAAYIALPGIGSKLAARIVNFRERLGGFYSIEQVGETFGLPDSTFQKIKPFLQFSPGGIKKININTITLDELKMHPYIRWQLANVIIRYRIQHGNFSSVEELRKIMIIKEDIFSKISPYCKVE